MKATANVSDSTYDILAKSKGNKRNMSKNIMSLHTILIPPIQCSNTTWLELDLYMQTQRGSEAPCFGLNGALTDFCYIAAKKGKKKSNTCIMQRIVIITTNKN